MTSYKEVIDQINREQDLARKEELKQQLEMMHQAADEESKQFEDLIRGDWSDWDE